MFPCKITKKNQVFKKNNIIFLFYSTAVSLNFLHFLSNYFGEKLQEALKAWFLLTTASFRIVLYWNVLEVILKNVSFFDYFDYIND